MLRNSARSAPLEPASIRIGNNELPIVFRRHAQARRLVLRLNAEATAITVTVPHGVSRNRALDFATRSHGWIARRLDARGESVTLAPGGQIPFRGTPHTINHVPSMRGLISVDAAVPVIHVPGELRHVPRRLGDWLKRMAREDLAESVHRYAAALGVQYRRITLRDQRSRWGSCSTSGELSFSWRLIMVPSCVLDYVAAHEVAHLKHMDHSPRFWRLVHSHCPHATIARTWLRTHGHEVHRIVL